MFTRRNIFLSIITFLLLIILIGCNFDIKVEYLINKNDLEIEFSGYVITETETIDYIKFDWGDKTNSTYIETGFDNIREKHKYNEEGTYCVRIEIKTISGKIYRTSIEVIVTKENKKKSFEQGVKFLT
ncbi:hypothetical protein [Natronospora cellulosivora (SeqCode)]